MMLSTKVVKTLLVAFLVSCGYRFWEKEGGVRGWCRETRRFCVCKALFVRGREARVFVARQDIYILLMFFAVNFRDLFLPLNVKV